MKSSSLIQALLLGATTASGSIVPRASETSSSSSASASPTATAPEDPVILLSEDEGFHFLLLGALETSSGDVNDVLAASKNIEPGNFTSWSDNWHALAQDTKKKAEDPFNAYDPLNVQDAWFATSSYYRQADFYNHENWTDPRINSYWHEQRAAFDKAQATLPIPGERIRVPTANFTVEAIWYTPAKDGAKRPTLVVGNGYDASQEASYHAYVVPALARGWNVMTYEGPGQPTVRRDQDIGFIPDWERVVTPVIDELMRTKGCLVDKERLALVGISMGGYLAARAAAFEPRIKALILNGGVWDVYQAYSAHLTPELQALHASGKQAEFDEVVSGMLDNPQLPSTIRWGLGHGLWCFKEASPFAWLNLLKQYTLASVIEKINMPVLVIDSDKEDFFAGQPALVNEALGDKATLKYFEGTAGYHCQFGASQEGLRYQFAWLHETLG